MTAEECVLLAVALDFHKAANSGASQARSPLLGPVTEIATFEQESEAMTFVRILVVHKRPTGQKVKGRGSTT